MRQNKYQSIILLIAIFFFFAGIGTTLSPASEGLDPVPDFTLKDLAGNNFKLSDYRGKVIIVNFWAVWCPPCQIEIPHLVTLNNKYKGKGLVILGIAISSGDDKKIKEKSQALGINYSVFNGDNAPSLRRSFPGVRAVPTSFLINQEGKCLKNYVGFSTETPLELEKDIKTLLKQ